jgi:hypothetical protein
MILNSPGNAGNLVRDVTWLHDSAALRHTVRHSATVEISLSVSQALCTFLTKRGENISAQAFQ